MLPIPPLPTLDEAGTGPAKRTRSGKGKGKGKASETFVVEPAPTEEGDSSPLAKKQKTDSGVL